MSSDFAEFLFSFACSKLESSPQLDLRQQLLHSNLIRHILLVHPPSPASSNNATTTADTHQDDDARRQLALPPLPPSPPPQQHSPAPQSLNSCSPSASPPSKSFAATTQSSNTYGLDLSSPFQQFQPLPQHQPLAGVALSNWSPFCFDDEFDRIGHPQAIMSQNAPVPGARGGGDHVALQDDQDVVMMEDEDPAALNLFPPYVYFRDSFHPTLSSSSYDYGYNLEEDDDDYRFASTRAQEDWLDAVLEDLIEEDQQDDDTSHEYDSEDDDLYCAETEDMGLTRGKTVKPDKDELIEPRSSAWSAQRGLFPDSMILDSSADAMWP
ncbi:hypothetical protein BGZ68_008884 [Mortierella alpina]|nr:hypothetical protein BGZ68_008884 [Mortierella alpina]